jgi:hypothetical protein
LNVSESFFFANDATKAYRWIKLSASQASNMINARVADIPAETLIKKR